jgi:glycosyltransferase involved in cell wall biosynthesis
LILLTTSDYLPKIGGLTSFTLNIENTLRELDLPYEIFHWKNPEEIKNFDKNKLKNYDLIINIHVMFSWLIDSDHDRMINFIHGSEILMTSPNILKKLYKRIFKKSYFEKMSKCRFNFFISAATLEKISKIGFKSDFSRDIIFHNCIKVSPNKLIEKNIDSDELVMTCIVRNVPHKNLLGTLGFVERVAHLFNRNISLIVPKNSNLNSRSERVKIIELKTDENEERDNAFIKAHFNLLMSKDESNKGFFEGFGLTILEAGKFSTPSIVLDTGGLGEAVHHKFTGWVLKEINDDEILHINIISNEDKYKEVSSNCYQHTVNNHSLEEYKKLIKLISIKEDVA